MVEDPSQLHRNYSVADTRSYRGTKKRVNKKLIEKLTLVILFLYEALSEMFQLFNYIVHFRCI